MTGVLLVCIYNKNEIPITHDYLFEIFSYYGTVLRVDFTYHTYSKLL